MVKLVSRVGPAGEEEIEMINLNKSKNNNEDNSGPIKNRSCTDIVFLILFLAAFGGLGYVGWQSYVYGDPFRLLYGVDSWGNVCGRTNTAITNVSFSGKDMTNATKQFFFDFSQFVTIPGVNLNPDLRKTCINTCPINSTMWTANHYKEFFLATSVNLCEYDFNYATLAGAATKCPGAVPRTRDILGRCVPEAAIGLATSAVNTASSAGSAAVGSSPGCDGEGTIFEKAARDIGASWLEIGYLCAASVGASFVVCLLLKFIAFIIIWVMIILMAVFALAATNTLNMFITRITTSPTDWFGIAVAMSVIAGIILLILLVMRKRIKLVVQLFREAGNCIGRMPLILLQPFWTFIVLAVFLCAFLVLYIYIESAGHVTVDANTNYVTWKQDDIMYYMKWYFLFMVLWTVQFIFACHELVLAGSVASWYFAPDKGKLGWPVLAATGRLIRYHLGTAAFGSFIIAVIQLCRIILSMVSRYLNKSKSSLAKFLLKCLQCCLWCFEKLMKFINKNAYIMTAIYGYSFCGGAKKAVLLLMKNVLRVGAINSVGAFCLFISKIGVVTGVTFLGLWLLESKQGLCYFWAPLVVAGLCSYFIAHTFLGVYGMAIDTIFLCFCEDCERNDGIEKPYFMSRGLMQYVENSKEAIAAYDARLGQGGQKSKKIQW